MTSSTPSDRLQGVSDKHTASHQVNISDHSSGLHALRKCCAEQSLPRQTRRGQIRRGNREGGDRGKGFFFSWLLLLEYIENAGRTLPVTPGGRTVRSPCQIITKYCTIDCENGSLAPLDIPMGSMQRVYY